MIKPRFAAVLQTTSFELTRSLAERAEAGGFDTVAIEDHFFIRGVGQQPQEPRLECFTALAAVALCLFWTPDHHRCLSRMTNPVCKEAQQVCQIQAVEKRQCLTAGLASSLGLHFTAACNSCLEESAAADACAVPCGADPEKFKSVTKACGC